MDENGLDNSSINKLIPEIFDQMRSNLSLGPSGKNMKPFLSASTTSSSMTAQSLLEENKCLDEIIPVIQTLESSLRSAGPQHLKRIRETCESSNKILDSWIRIQSQAGYAYELMDDKSYLEYVVAAQQNAALTPQAYLEQKQAQVADLRRTLDEKIKSRENAYAEEKQRQMNENNPAKRERRYGAASRAPTRGNMKKPSGIPRSTSRITKPSARAVRPTDRAPR
ncbi:LAME_0C07074g1_1 [Lachancea meyersii CBS 8951]|uniref:DASH complex subunit DUO1 n=1 Tax=Lachancea meyersii CBS 8951 TaxID=1266667 RepID=A0A1G4J2J3_9SACH|nr:LAME_0C07074g1_1 [Lachancea meyersii CBS 8951]